MNVKLKSSSKGVTLLELAIVVAIIGIVSAIAGARYDRIMRTSETNKAARAFESSIKLAKNKAHTSTRAMTICGSANVNDANPTCLASLATFNQAGNSENTGWLVYWDKNGNGMLDAADPIYKKAPFSQRHVRMVWSAATHYPIEIAPRNETGDNGTLCVYAPYDGGTISNCDPSSTPNAELSETRITLSTLGTVTVKK